MTQLSKDVYLEAVKALKEADGNKAEAAKSLGLSRTTLRDRIKAGEKWYGDVTRETAFAIDFPDLPSGEMDIEELIEHRKDRFTKRVTAAQAREWMEFKMKFDGPYGLCFVGDPHMDDNGCNWPLLEHHINMVRETDGMFGIGLGDYTNNWSGYLSQKIHPHQETTRSQAWQLAEWFFGAIPWMLLIKGNHDMWSMSHGTGDPLDYMKRGEAPLEDWEARFVVKSNNGHKVRIHVAHNFKGHSQWNPLHGLMKKARFSGEACLYVAGDRHNWAVYQEEDPEKGNIFWAARARGYKYIDPHARHLGFEEQKFGCSITAVIDPTVTGPECMYVFASVDEACEFLDFKRAKWKIEQNS